MFEQAFKNIDDTLWKRVIMSTSGMYGDLQGIVGASLPAIKLLELPSGEEDELEVA